MNQRQVATLARKLKSAIRERKVRLRHASDRTPGFQRKRHGTGFRFVTNDGQSANRIELKRINKLAIPPAWTNVWICPYENGHLQATGRDARSRKQYIYHPDWRVIREETKFDRLARFARALPKIRRRVARDLRRPGLSREKVIATVVRLLEQTHIRIGNPEYAEQNQSFGLTTMRNGHVAVNGRHLDFHFNGKSGRFHRIEVSDERLARIVKRCRDLPGYQLFEYLDDQGEVRSINSSDVNDYLHEIAGEEFSAKDFRTWAGTVHAARVLRRMADSGRKKPKKSSVIDMIDEVAELLGNTRSVCRKYYIHPGVTSAYLDGSLAQSLVGSGSKSGRSGLTSEESAILRLLDRLRTGRRTN